MRFCFFSPYKDLKGGFTTLLITLIVELVRQNQDVVLINFKDGLIQKELEKENIDIPIVDVDAFLTEAIEKSFTPDDVFIITFFNENLHRLMRLNPKLVYYDINDFICQISAYKFGLHIPALSRKLISRLLSKNALVFMDDTGITNIKSRYDINVRSPQYVPVPIETRGEQNLYFSKKGAIQTINITCITRSVRWKLSVLEKLFIDACNASNDLSLTFHILTDDMRAFDRIIPLHKYKSRHITYQFYENYPPSEIDQFLIDKSDINFGMGTTALHSARLGIPTVLLDYSEEEFPDNYSYSWIFLAKNYSLGRNIQKRGFSAGQPLLTILNEISSEERRIHVSKKCFDYVRRSHDSEAVVRKLIEKAAKTTFRLQDTKWLIPYYYKAHRILKQTLNSPNQAS